MEKIQVIQPTKLLAPYIKQYWFLRIDDVKQGFQRSIPAGCAALVFHKGYLQPVITQYFVSYKSEIWA